MGEDVGNPAEDQMLRGFFENASFTVTYQMNSSLDGENIEGEWTWYLDAENERLVQKALDEAMTGRTTLVVAHRLSTVRDADLVIVIDHGRIVESGTHAELMDGAGHYARIAELQLSGRETR